MIKDLPGVLAEMDFLLGAPSEHDTETEAAMRVRVQRWCDILTKYAATLGADPVAYVITALKNSGVDTECGACMEVAFTGVTTNAHTCQPAAVNHWFREANTEHNKAWKMERLASEILNTWGVFARKGKEQDAIFQMRSRLDTLAPPVGDNECVWLYIVADGIWRTSCGMFWNFDDSNDPKYHDVNFCPKCGKTLKVGNGNQATTEAQDKQSDDVA